MSEVVSELINQREVDNIDDINQRMLEAARASDWQAVTILEAHRQELVRNLLADHPDASSIPLLVECISTTLEVNDTLISLGHKARDYLMEELRSISKGRKAKQAYADHATL